MADMGMLLVALAERIELPVSLMLAPEVSRRY